MPPFSKTRPGCELIIFSDSITATGFLGKKRASRRVLEMGKEKPGQIRPPYAVGEREAASPGSSQKDPERKEEDAARQDMRVLSLAHSGALFALFEGRTSTSEQTGQGQRA